ncbi:MAG: PD-(D/E)XK nuclease family protein [Calditrichia bacterium]
MPGKPTFELITGPSAGYYFFKDEIVERVRATRGNEYDFVYLLPVKRAVRRFKELLMDALPARALIDPPVYTFYEFMLKVHRSRPQAPKVISPAMQLFLVEEILRNNVKNLRFFSKENAERRGLVRKVDKLITELREYGYTPDQLLNQDDIDDQRLQDFSLLLQQFDETLTSQGLLDEAGAIQQLSMEMDGLTWREHFPELQSVYLNGYGMFTRPMLNAIENLQTVCNVKIKMDYFEGQPLLFEHLQKAHYDLTGLNPLRKETAEPHPWEEKLFQRKNVTEQTVLPGKDLLIQANRNKREEVAFIAAYARRLHSHKGIPLSNIGITFPSLEEYAPLIHEIFQEYGIPYNLSTGYALSQSPLIRSLLLLLEIPLQGFEVKKIVQLLGSPFYRKKDTASKLDSDLLKKMAVELRLTHLHSSWKEKVANRLSYLRSVDAEDDDSFAIEAIRRKADLYESAAAELKSLLELFAPLTGKQDVTEFRETFLDLLDTLGFLDWYKGDESDVLTLIEQEREYRAFNRFNKLLDQFSWIVSNLQKSAASEKGSKMSLKQLHQYLTLLISDATYNTREWSQYGVQVMPRLEILAMEPQVLLFGGMVENRFPRPFTHDVFFNDEKRESLGLAATEDLLAQDRYMFYQILRAPAERLIFTYPQFERESARVPSNFLNIMEDRLKLRFRKRPPSAAFLRSPRRLLERVAGNIPPGLKEFDRRAVGIWQSLEKTRSPKRANEIDTTASMWLEKVDVSYRKRRREVFNDYEGMLDKHSDITASLDASFGDAAFSVTRLESYAFCPIQFFFRYIMKLEEEREAESGMTALERGQLVHNTFFRFYSALREETPDLLQRPWEARDLLYEIAAEEFDKLPFSGLLFEIERERYFGSPNKSGLWDAFLEQEKEQIENLQFFPAFFEVGFGETGLKKEQDKISLEQPIEIQQDGKTLKLIGKIDRIDLSADSKQAMLLDYKTGFSAVGPRNVRDGMSLQLPIYAVVLPRLLGKAGKRKEAKAILTAIYQVRDADNCERKPVMFDKESGIPLSQRGHAALPNGYIKDEYDTQLSFDDMLNRSQEMVFKYVEQIRGGVFRHTRFPKEAACESHCEFKRMCRKNVRKLLH